VANIPGSGSTPMTCAVVGVSSRVNFPVPQPMSAACISRVIDSASIASDG
jgi:hypothetical protein